MHQKSQENKIVINEIENNELEIQQPNLKSEWVLYHEIQFFTTYPCQRSNSQGLIQKEKADIDLEKSKQISIVVKKTATQRWLKYMIMEHKQATHYNSQHILR